MLYPSNAEEMAKKRGKMNAAKEVRRRNNADFLKTLLL
jgi:hypothetical protein